MACFGRDQAVVTRYLLDEQNRPRVSLVLSFH